VSGVDRIYLFGLPVPPSVNGQYKSILVGRKIIRAKSSEAVSYEKVFASWAAEHRDIVASARKEVQRWASPLSVSMYVCLERSKIFTKDGRMKRMDVSNRSKSLHDLLANVLGVDDSIFSHTPMEKVLCDERGEQVIIELRPHPIRKLQSVNLFSGPPA